MTCFIRTPEDVKQVSKELQKAVDDVCNRQSVSFYMPLDMAKRSICVEAEVAIRAVFHQWGFDSRIVINDTDMVLEMPEWNELVRAIVMCSPPPTIVFSNSKLVEQIRKAQK
jgi:hypothetical protein